MKLHKYQANMKARGLVKQELEKHGYHAKVSDERNGYHLTVFSDKVEQFNVIVVSLIERNFWLVKDREIEDRLFYVLVYAPLNDTPKFFIFSSSEMKEEREKYRKHIENLSGKYKDEFGGINWKTAFNYENRWNILPK